MAVAADATVILTGAALGKLDASGAKITAFGQGFSSPQYFVSSPLPAGADLYAMIYDSAARSWGIARFDAQGRFFTGFGNGGIVSTGLFSGQLLRDDAGNLYMAATFPSGGIESLWLAKYDPDGRQVLSFGAGGFAKLDLGGQRAFLARAVVDSDGSVYVLGSVPSASSIVVAKFDASGRQSTDFGSNGTWLRACGDRADATAIAIDAAHNVYVGATCLQPGGVAVPALFKLDARGNIVTSFRDGGLRASLFGGNGVAYGRITALLAAGGAVYAAGETGEPQCQDFTVAKLDADGIAVAAFGDNGIARFDKSDDALTDLELDDRGRLYLGGVVSSCGLAGKRVVGYAVYRLGG